MFIPGVCAGALLMLFVLAFAVGSATSERPLHAESQPFTVVMYVTALPLSSAPTATAPPPAATPTMTPSPATPSVSGILAIVKGEQQARTPTGVLTATLDQFFAREEICPIRPGTCPYGFLVGNLDPGIAFPADSPTLSVTNRLMHPAMVKPLAALRAEVLKRWMGQHSLAVLGAYTDSAPASGIDLELRSQGQLAVLTLLPRPSEDDLALLCGMAFQAGFDWVRNDGNTCRVAMKAVPLCQVCQSTVSTPEPTATVGIVTFTPTAPTVTATPGITDTPAPPLTNPSTDVSRDSSAPIDLTPIP